MSFKKAVRAAKRAKITLSGPSGSGKTATALRLARGLAGPDGKVAVIDTERGSASLYAGRFGGEWDKDDELPDFSPKTLMDRLREAERLGYAAVVVDSLSHFWMGKGGELEMVDAAKKRSKSGDGFGAWNEVTPVHNELIQCLLTVKLHVVCTMRTKTEWVIEQNERGKNAPRKVGTAPVQRDGMEFEFDLAGDMDAATMVVSKTRLEPIPLGAVYKEAGEALGEQIARWLSDAPNAQPAAPAAGAARAAAGLDVREGESEEHAKQRQAGVFYAQLVKACSDAGQPDLTWKAWLRGNAISRQQEVTAVHLASFRARLADLVSTQQEPGAAG